jgi:hypothetical protein
MAEKVLIGCKLPHGLYLDLHDKNNTLIARVKITGCAGFTLPNPDRKFQNPVTVHGDAFTLVDKAHWEEWLKVHASHPAVLNGAIYASAKQVDAEAKAKEHETEDVGFNKVDPKNFGVQKLDGKDAPAFV